MDRRKANIFKLIALLTPIGVLPFALAEDNLTVGEDYYGNDIDAAIHEANQNDRSLDYANRYWYNRTTEKSFLLPKLPADDLEKTNLPGAIDASAAGSNMNSNDTVSDSLLNTQTELSENQRTFKENSPQPIGLPSTITIENIKFTPLIQHEFSQGNISVQGTVASGSVTSTPRP